MIEIQMSKDIRDFAPKLLGPFTSRQVIVILIALVYSIPMLLFLPWSFWTRATVVAVLALPTVACGWVAPFGMPLEKFALKVIRITFFSVSKRKYVSQNEYEEEYNRISPPEAPMKRSKKSKKIKSYK